MKDFDEEIVIKKILVVDDEAFMRSVLAGILKQMGCKYVQEARNGNDALKLLEERDFDVVFCDWEMPGMSGIELYEKIRTDEKFQQVHFVMVTGNSSSVKVREAIAQGIKEYIVKPFNQQIIKKKLETFFC